MSDVATVYEQLTNILSEKQIKRALDGEGVNEWEYASYPVIIKAFAKKAGKHSEKAWVQRLAYTFSWLQSTPHGATPATIRDELTAFEREFQDVKLKKITFSDDGETKVIRHKKKSADLMDFLQPASMIIYEKENIDSQLAAITKLLHFMLPELFPIFDHKVSKKLFGTPYYSSSRYYTYMQAVKQYMNEGENRKYLKKACEKKGVSPLIVLYHATLLGR